MTDNRSIFTEHRNRARQEAGFGDGRAYFSAEAKERLAQDSTPLYLHQATRTKGQFGWRWELELSEDDPSTPTGILTMPSNEYRDSMFGGLKADLRAGPIGPLALKSVQYKLGSGWDLVEWTEASSNPLPF